MLEERAKQQLLNKRASKDSGAGPANGSIKDPQTTNKKVAIIIGAGPAGLTAAYELLHRSGVKPIVFEVSDDIGGLAKTVNYKGNRIDIGGHRFFSKSDRVMEW